MTTRDLLLSKRLPGNALDQQAASRRALTELANRDINVPQLSGIATDFGLINAGTIVMGNGQPLGNGFTGMMRFADALEWPAGSGKLWTDIAFASDVMTFGISALDGKLYAAAGALFVDMSGVATTGLNYFWNMQATFNSNTNTAKTGMFVPYNAYGGSPEPAWQTTFQTSAGSNLLTNGDFETGDFTGWTTGGTGAWSVVTSPPAPQSGTYSAKCQLSTGLTGTLSPSSRLAISALQPYEFVAYLAFAGGQTVWAGHSETVTISFYTSLVGGSLLDSYTYYLPVNYSGQWAKFWKILTSPANAAAVQVSFSLNGGSGASAWPVQIDAVSVKNIQSYSQVSMQPEFTLDGSGINLEELQENASNQPTVQQPSPGFGHLYARRKTHGLALYRSFGDVLDVFLGSLAGYGEYDTDNTEHTISSTTINAGSMGTKGGISVALVGRIKNSTGSPASGTIKAYIGSTLVFQGGAMSVGSGSYLNYKLDLSLTNAGAANAQQVSGFMSFNAVTLGAAATASTNQSAEYTAAEDSTTDLVFKVTCTLNVSSANLKHELKRAQLSPFCA